MSRVDVIKMMQVMKKGFTWLSYLMIMCTFVLLYIRFLNQNQGRDQHIQFTRAVSEKNYALAEKHINAALETWSDNALFWANQAVLMERMATKRKSPDSLLLQTVKFSDHEQKLIEQAIHNIHKAIELNKLDDCFYHNLGWLYMYQGKTDSAVKTLQKSIDTDPTIETYYVSLGLIYSILGQTNNALEYFQQAICISPDIIESSLFLLLQQQGLTDRLLESCHRQLETEMQISPNPIIKARLAGFYYYQKNFIKADSILKEVTAELENLNRPWYYLGQINQNKISVAESYYLKSHILDRSDYLPYIGLAKINARKDRWLASISYYISALERAERLYSHHALRVSRIYFASGSGQYEMGLMENDIIPNGLLAAMSPMLNKSEICDHIVELLTLNDKTVMAEQLKSLNNCDPVDLSELLTPLFQ